MPEIDVTDVLASLGIAAQRFGVVRREERVNEYGESERTVNKFVATGAVQPAGDNGLNRSEVMTTSSRGISVWTMTPLFNYVRKIDENKRYQPDIVYWEKNYYTVMSVDSWLGFGSGFVKADCQLFDYVPETSDLAWSEEL